MKRILFLFMTILLATGLASAQKKAVISAEEVSYNFGAIKESDGKVSHTFVVSNTGDMPLVITRVIASCGCTTPEWPKEPVAPGKNAEIKVYGQYAVFCILNDADRAAVFTAVENTLLGK